MSVEHVEVLVEEPSMEAALRQLLPRLMGDLSFEIYTHQGKRDLLERLPERLKGYKKWLPVNFRIVVVIDRDNDDCIELKSRLELIAKEAGFTTRSSASNKRYIVVNRLAIEELEAWYFGDWDAVRSAYPRVPVGIPWKKGFRDPDAISGGTWEIFERILNKAGYFKGGLRKIEAARTIVKNFKPTKNTSKSYQVFRDTMLELASL
jgi:hypothetical protein